MWLLKKKKVIDLTKSGKYKGMPSQIPETYKDLTPSSSDSEADSGLGFLGTMASFSNSSGSLAVSANLDTKHLSIKIEDIEDKLKETGAELRKKFKAMLQSRAA